MTFLVYLPSFGHDFVNFDDPYYITGNAAVRSGLTVAGLRWAFTTLDNGNWHPLTWLSHMTDVQLFGINPAGHHLVSILLHALNTGLLGLLLFRFTGRRWESSLVAALFGLHPLHVESVAWVSERKDLLSTFFGILALLAYERHARRRRRVDAAAAAFFHSCGLMAKPMLLTLPLLMLILDFWPLGRTRAEPLRELVRRKAPLLCLSAAAGGLAFLAQLRAGAVEGGPALSLLQRVGNAAISYAAYVGKMIWPSPLAVFYPLGEAPPLEKVIAAVLFLSGATWLAVRSGTRRPALLAGWLWYLITLLPVIGLVQIGGQAMADRYTYFTMNGLFVALVWGAVMPAMRTRARRAAAGAASLALAVVLGLATSLQLPVWKNSLTLFGHALESGVDSWRARAHLAEALTEEGKLPEAVRHYTEAARLAPSVPHVRVNLGALLYRTGRAEEALPHLAEALRLQPQMAEAHYNLGLALGSLGRMEEGSTHLRQALAIDPALGR